MIDGPLSRSSDNDDALYDGGASQRVDEDDRAGFSDRFRGSFGRAIGWARRYPLFTAAFVFSLLAAIYWLFIATDRYVSNAHVIVQRTDLTSGASNDLASVLLDGGAGNREDQLILRDYLRSRDMMMKVDRELNLREHYSQASIDPFSRLSFGGSPENMHDYYLDRITVNFDDYAGVLVIEAEAFDAPTARRITTMMVAEGEQFMNRMAQSLAQDQVGFLEDQTQRLGQRAMSARQALLAYQNRQGIVSPQASTEAIGAVVANLESQRSELQVELASLQAYLVPNHPSIVELQQQISAIDRQIAQENSRLAGGGNRLNTKLEQFQRLEMEAEFAQQLYQTALTALEKGRVEGTRTIKKMSIIEDPTMPGEASRPDRIYQAVLYAFFAFVIAGILQLLVAIVRDHKD